MSNNFVDVFPNKVILTRTNNQNFLESKLTLTNKTDKYVIFKVYINKATIYSANPSTSFIPPRESTVVSIKKLEMSLTNDQLKKDKFLILIAQVDQVVRDQNDSRALVKQIDMKSEENQQIVLEAEIDPDYEKTLNGTITKEFIVDNPEVNSKITEYTKQIKDLQVMVEEIKRKKQEYEMQIDKLENQIKIQGRNNMLIDSKERGKTINLSIALETPVKESVRISNSYPLSFVILLGLIGLTIGAYINKLVSK